MILTVLIVKNKFKKMKINLSILVFLIVGNFFAQVNVEQNNWHNTDPAGLHTEKAYILLKDKQASPVLVAVIDSGVDCEHEDLAGKIWTNLKEIPNNKIDDDGNGYVDDIHGWNFLGNAKGEMQDYACYEKVRMYRALRDKYERLKESQIKQEDKEEYAFYLKVKNEITSEVAEYKGYQKQYEQLPMLIKYIPQVVSQVLGKPDYTLEDLEKWKPTDAEGKEVKMLAEAILNGGLNLEVIEEQTEQVNAALKYQLNIDYNDREFVDDTPSDFTQVKYGNNIVEGKDANHGTHVAGIIAAIRNNNLGLNGIADNAQIMVLRAVPNGDEQDKDIALAIRYAVDNGAKIINMSFGKGYSPFQKEVYEALAYASSKDVLLVHAAGNDGKNIDVEPNFPTPLYAFQKEKLPLFLTIGASTKNAKKHLAADFSNYGKVQVDVFAPGKDIYSTIPQSAYKKYDGTSMAAPMVAGVAALLKSYFPSLTMLQIKNNMLLSAKYYGKTKQIIPGTENTTRFSDLSVTGGVVDLEEAVKLCEVEVGKMK
jgi:subtilisin family serine protease